ncbi:hypothetical protein IMZ48_02885 [Candidatus Bathyarchaeota archaeon]|nr:hypothetical protein [Candidatus Bathyarchaeota archaeon]
MANLDTVSFIAASTSERWESGVGGMSLMSRASAFWRRGMAEKARRLPIAC